MKFLLGLAIAAASLRGGAVYDASASFTGTRSAASGGGLSDGGGIILDDLTLTWSILTLPGATYNYTYTITGAIITPVSYLLLQDNGCNPSKSATCVWDASINGLTPAIVSGEFLPGLLSPGLADGINGLEFPQLPVGVNETVTISFNSPAAPVWGDFYLTGASQYVLSLGNLNHADADTTDFVAVPNFDPAPSPEPATLLLTGAALTALGLMRRGQRGR